MLAILVAHIVMYLENLFYIFGWFGLKNKNGCCQNTEKILNNMNGMN